MWFLLIYAIIAGVCIMVTAPIFLADTQILWLKFLIYFGLIYAWFAPIFIWLLQPKTKIFTKLYAVFAQSGYFMYGFVFLLTVSVMIYNLIWSMGYLFGSESIKQLLNPENLKYAHYIILGMVLSLSLYAAYAAERSPRIKKYAYKNTRILKPLTMLVVADLHITKMTPMDKIEQWVNLFNRLKPDLVVLPGDIADDVVENIRLKIHQLKKIHAPMGIFYTVGNHEIYFDRFAWEAEFASLGWQVLHNSGVEVENTGIFIGGVPNVGQSDSQIKQVFGRSDPQKYKILLSHDPATICHLKQYKIDLQISGHTHGGQIFPFHFLVKLGNHGMLAGKYSINATDVLISRGVGYWGPPMRLWAPSDVLLIHFSSSDE